MCSQARADLDLDIDLYPDLDPHALEWNGMAIKPASLFLRAGGRKECLPSTNRNFISLGGVEPPAPFQTRRPAVNSKHIHCPAQTARLLTQPSVVAMRAT